MRQRTRRALQVVYLPCLRSWTTCDASKFPECGRYSYTLSDPVDHSVQVSSASPVGAAGLSMVRRRLNRSAPSPCSDAHSNASSSDRSSRIQMDCNNWIRLRGPQFPPWSSQLCSSEPYLRATQGSASLHLGTWLSSGHRYSE